MVISLYRSQFEVCSSGLSPRLYLHVAIFWATFFCVLICFHAVCVICGGRLGRLLFLASSVTRQFRGYLEAKTPLTCFKLSRARTKRASLNVASRSFGSLRERAVQ